MKNAGWQLLAAALVLGASTAALAQPRFGPPRPPPQAAFDACANQKAGDTCSFNHDGRTVDGTCRSGPDGGKVACAPAMPPPHEPPQAALDACANLKAGDTCSFSHDGHTMNGTCRQGPDGSRVACAPAMPPPHEPPRAAYDACANRRSGDTCSVTIDGRQVEGACRTAPDGQRVVCAPNRPAHGPHHGGPPPAALDACKNLREGDTCSFTVDGNQLDGACRAGPPGAPLGCASKSPPPGAMPR